MKIAIFTPLKKEEAETFIQNHISNLPFEKVVVYGGNFPHLAANHLPNYTLRLQFRLLRFFKKLFGIKIERYETFQLTRILKKEKVDVVFAEYLITGAETLEVLKKMKIPIVAIALGYEISMHHMIERYASKYRELFRYAKNILVVSRHMQINLEKLGCSKEKIIYSPAGPSSDFFEIKPSFLNNQVLAIGRFVDKKAPHLSILAFKKVVDKIPNAILVMAGDGYLLNACKDLVRILDIEDSVKFVGRINREQHKFLLKESSLFIQHSKVADDGDSEGTPVAILEASAAGLPIVSTLHAGIPDVVIDGKTGFLVSENNVELMSEKIRYLLNNKEEAIEFGRKGKEFVKDNFSLDTHIKTIEKYINQCV